MNPLHFGSTGRRLYGVFHPASGDRIRARAVILCPPAFAEYMRSHRALRQLAILLARRGFPSLRFDYYGTGDSEGEGSAATLEQWRRDVHEAVDEALALSGRDRAVVMGLRLGAALAYVEGCANPDVVEAVLWDPVVDPDAFLEDQARQHTEGSAATATGDDVLGFPLPAGLRAEITGIGLPAPVPGALDRLLLVHGDDPEYLHWATSLAAGPTAVETSRQSADSVWARDSVNPKELVPMATLEAIVAWIDDRGPAP